MLDGNQACLVAAAHGNLAFALWLPRMAIKLAWLPRMAINQAFLVAAAHGSFLLRCLLCTAPAERHSGWRGATLHVRGSAG